MGEMTQRRATIIYNPASGRKGRRAENAEQMARLLAERGIEAEARATTGPEDATRLAREAIAGRSGVIISYGGDGTLNEVIQAMVGRDAVLAIWAGGTANVVARDLQLPSDPSRLADIIAAGKIKRITLGKASGQWSVVSGQKSGVENPPTTDHRSPTTRYFVMFAGIGLDAAIARGVNTRLKRRAGEFAYWMSGIKHLFQSAAEFTVEVEGKRYESGFTLVGNGKGYGGDVVMAKNAALDEDEFEVFVLPTRKRNYAYVGSLVKCMAGKPERAGATIVKTNRIVATSKKETWVELDGELVGTLPMTFETVPDALSVIVP